MEQLYLQGSFGERSVGCLDLNLLQLLDGFRNVAGQGLRGPPGALDSIRASILGLQKRPVHAR